ncbi:MAG: galactose oxidase-like domain-containing protein [Planctomycetota bacterium]
MEADQLSWGEELELHCDPLPVGVAVEKVVLISPGSVTHHTDMHQRYVECPILEVEKGNRVRFKVPSPEPLLPRGLYMLWMVTNAGAPSHAMWVVVR